MEAGINGASLKFGKCNRFLSRFYELVQQLGRVDRKGNTEPGSNTYEIYVDFFSYASLSLRIMKLECKEEQKIQITQLYQVLELVVLPTEYYHVAMERYFERETSADHPSCPKHCSKRGENADATGRIKKVGW